MSLSGNATYQTGIDLSYATGNLTFNVMLNEYGRQSKCFGHFTIKVQRPEIIVEPNHGMFGTVYIGIRFRRTQIRIIIH